MSYANIESGSGSMVHRYFTAKFQIAKLFSMSRGFNFYDWYNNATMLPHIEPWKYSTPSCSNKIIPSRLDTYCLQANLTLKKDTFGPK